MYPPALGCPGADDAAQGQRLREQETCDRRGDVRRVDSGHVRRL